MERQFQSEAVDLEIYKTGNGEQVHVRNRKDGTGHGIKTSGRKDIVLVVQDVRVSFHQRHAHFHFFREPSTLIEFSSDIPETLHRAEEYPVVLGDLSHQQLLYRCGELVQRHLNLIEAHRHHH